MSPTRRRSTPRIASRAASVEGTILARQLVNEPPNALGPVEFADEAKKLEALGVGVEVLDPKAMEKLGMGSLLAVARGSARPARLVVLQWKGGKSGDAPCAFVGKGVVFDTGGISIKPAASMEDMKGDMGGAAAVTGLFHALATRKAKVNAVGVLGLVENMPDGNAMRPGDILKSMSGKTIEVVNTDAEGRLVLADALWYAQQRFKPKFLIDLATLTGAIIVALGQDHGGLFSNNDELSARLLAAGLSSGEKLWRMPLSPAYERLIESRFADIKNSGGRLAGSSDRCALPPALRQQRALGPPRYRRHGLRRHGQRDKSFLGLGFRRCAARPAGARSLRGLTAQPPRLLRSRTRTNLSSSWGTCGMAFLFYILAWLSILGGAAYSGYLVVNATRGLTGTDAWIAFALNQGLPVTMPGLQVILAGLVLLAIAGILSRLDEIAYNTRPLS